MLIGVIGNVVEFLALAGGGTSVELVVTDDCVAM